MIIDIVFRDRPLVEELGLKLLAVHCHGDHVTGAWLMQQATGDGSKIQRVFAFRVGPVFCPPDT